MNESAEEEKWVTVSELRQRFNLTQYQANTISGFLRRLKSGTFGQFPFIVAKIEKTYGEKPSAPKKCRYLLKLREWTPECSRKAGANKNTGNPFAPHALGPDNPRFCTDYDAVQLFNKILNKEEK
ncbi:MAG: hypothetical protein METHP_00507 [Methanoregula sp. SKADARSKE-2]|nr:MAG: hypothetical protein METHP_00507 [Methanoregula sp. SKADARSKE-2]